MYDNTISVILSVNDINTNGLQTIISNAFDMHPEYYILKLGGLPLTYRSFINLQLNNEFDTINVFTIHKYKDHPIKNIFIEFYEDYCKNLEKVKVINPNSIDHKLYRQLFVTGFMKINELKEWL